MNTKSKKEPTVQELSDRIQVLEKRLSEIESNKKPDTQDDISFHINNELRRPYIVTVKEFIELANFITDIFSKFDYDINPKLSISYKNGENFSTYDLDKVLTEGRNKRPDLRSLSLFFHSDLLNSVSINFYKIPDKKNIYSILVLYSIELKDKTLVDLLDEKLKSFLEMISDNFSKIDFSNSSQLEKISQDNLVPLTVDTIQVYNPRPSVSNVDTSEKKVEKTTRTFPSSSEISRPILLTIEDFLELINKLEKIADQYVVEIARNITVHFKDRSSQKILDISRMNKFRNTGEEEIIRISYDIHSGWDETESIYFSISIDFNESKLHRVVDYLSTSTNNQFNILIENEINKFISQCQQKKYPKLLDGMDYNISLRFMGYLTFLWVGLVFIFLFSWNFQVGILWKVLITIAILISCSLAPVIVGNFIDKIILPKVRSLYPYSVLYLGGMKDKYDSIIETRKKFFWILISAIITVLCSLIGSIFYIIFH